ncbi:alpha/beta hydrolase [Leptolyngbyaceae cyanobacterium CCMR0082]|uniref:Alpha/beta hydrolase n=1 Tax=Adonisia turfae CCMR0082 TaxID=2304604 RepID=A0A6M0SE77_9CYAN|nr:alpha/beta hydrolase [Adonisia turfae]NEZ66281.1 alpha/beta hydrolase [Adonisia turfae CCMR0082]
MKTTNLLTLPDNRRLAYAEYGNPNGHPVLYFHGGGASRLEPLLLGDEVFIRLGLRLIAPDRPGIGQSNFQPNRGFSDWTKDVIFLADTLGLDKFSVLGVSSGGGYTAACAAKIPHRLYSAVIVSGAWEFTAADLLKYKRWDLFLIKYFPWLYQVSMRSTQRSLNAPPDKLLKTLNKRLPAADYAVIKSPGQIKQSCETLNEGLRSGTRGTAWDLQLYFRKWDFGLDEIRMPLTLFYGEEDRNVPLDLVKQIAATLPTTKLVMYPNEGHISVVVNQIESIAKALLSE